MPIYEYRCSQCGEVFEMFRNLSEADDRTECPKCGNNDIERVLSAVSSSVGKGTCGGSTGFS